MKQIYRFLIWLDREVNDKWLGGYFETISGRCFYTKCWCCVWLCKVLNTVDKDHCKNAYLFDRKTKPSLEDHAKLL